MNSTKRFIIPVSVVTRRARPNLVTTVEYLFLFNRNKNLWGEHREGSIREGLAVGFCLGSGLFGSCNSNQRLLAKS